MAGPQRSGADPIRVHAQAAASPGCFRSGLDNWRMRSAFRFVRNHAGTGTALHAACLTGACKNLGALILGSKRETERLVLLCSLRFDPSLHFNSESHHDRFQLHKRRIAS